MPAHGTIREKVPLYLQLASVMRRKVETGEWRDGNTLPSFEKLASKFEVARVTVRQAIATLEAEGLVKRRQGKGTFVTYPKGINGKLSLHASWEALVKLIEGTELQLLTSEPHVPCPLLIQEDGRSASAYRYMQRVHSKEGRPYALHDIYLAEHIFALVPERFEETMVLPILSELPEVEIAAAWQSLTVDAASAEIASILGIPFQAPIANVRRVVRNSEGEVIYLASVVYRGDFVKFDIDLISEDAIQGTL